jgi:hypothetical protein
MIWYQVAYQTNILKQLFLAGENFNETIYVIPATICISKSNIPALKIVNPVNNLYETTILSPHHNWSCTMLL